MKKRINFCKGVFSLLTTIGFITMTCQNAYAYDFAMTGAYQDGTVTITALNSGQSANGYSTLGGYKVDYSLTENFVAFEGWDGCDFYIGSAFAPSGGCQFAYKPNGILWEQGALQLGALVDGFYIGSAEPDASNTVRASFNVNDLSDLPEYICYAYQPASGAYLHITDSYGPKYHVWYYQTLKNRPVENLNTIDMDGPNVSASVAAAGTTATIGGKKWGTQAVVTVSATDEKSRPANVRLYKNGSELGNTSNRNNDVSFSERYTVNENGAYQVKSSDQLGNEGSAYNFSVDCIDTTAPGISKFFALTNGFCKEVTLEVAASDSGCGLHAQAYSFNGGAWTASNRIDVTENGTYTVRVRDALGNENSKSITVSNIDKASPVIESITHNNERYCTQNEVVVTAKDLESGLHVQAYSFNNGEWTSGNRFPVTANGLYIVRVRDAVGNIAEQSVTVNNIDREKPILSTEVKHNGEVVYVEDIAWTREKYAHLSVTDDKSGLKKVIIRKIDEGEEDELIFEPDEQGMKEWSFETDALPAGDYQIVVFDLLDNSETGAFVVENVDNSAPIIDSVHQILLDDGKIRIEVEASDEGGSGLAVNAYSFDGGKTWQEDPFLEVDENDVYEIVVRDNVDLQDCVTETVDGIKKKEDHASGNPGDENPSDNSGDGSGNPSDNPGDGSGNPSDNPGDGSGNPSDNPGDGSGNPSDNPGDGSGNPSGNPGGGSGNPSDNPGDGSGNPSDNPGDGSGNPSDNPGDGSGNPSDNTGNRAGNPADNPGNGKKNDSNSQTKKKVPETTPSNNDYDDFHEEDITKLITPNSDDDVIVITKEKMEEALNNKEIEVEELANNNLEAKKQSDKKQAEKMVKRIAAVALASILIIGLIALGLYLLLSALHYSCVLYAVGDHNKRKKMARLPVKTFSDDWLVEVPNDKLGDLGTGRYVLVFSTALVKEGPEDYVVITIDKNRFREKLEEEIAVKI